MSFQVDNVKSVHVIGAVFAFIVGGVYFYIQAYISWYAKDIPGSSKLVRIAQLIICALYAVFAIIGSKIAFIIILKCLIYIIFWYNSIRDVFTLQRIILRPSIYTLIFSHNFSL